MNRRVVMKVFLNTDFESFYGGQSAAIVIAENPIEAAKMLNRRLRELKMQAIQKSSNMVEISLETSAVYIPAGAN